MEQTCPFCGVVMWIEGGGTFLKHPVPHECHLAGKAWPMRKKNPKSPRKTWYEFKEANTAKTPPPAAPASKTPMPPPVKPEIPE